jgi:hypothetical protein
VLAPAVFQYVHLSYNHRLLERRSNKRLYTKAMDVWWLGVYLQNGLLNILFFPNDLLITDFQKAALTEDVICTGRVEAGCTVYCNKLSSKHN